MTSVAHDTWTLERDLDAVVDLARDDFAALDGARLFVTGGTGFIGCWLLGHDCALLYQLVTSSSLWERRMAVLAPAVATGCR